MTSLRTAAMGRSSSATLPSSSPDSVSYRRIVSTRKLTGIIEIMWNAWADMKLAISKEGANGNAVGRFWVPSSQDPEKQTRVGALEAHFYRVQSRPNYHLLTMHQATKINFSGTTATGISLVSRQTKNTKSVSARKEVILAAGAVHTPQLLQLSGIGPKKVLSAAGVSTRVELDGVGQNLQDHPFFPMAHVCKYSLTSSTSNAD